jgi:hypothetical protein
VLGVEDVEELLGKRPYECAEMRNIDRFRRTQPSAEQAEQEAAGEEQQEAAAQAPGDGPQGGSAEPAMQPPAREPGVAVAT